MSRTYLVFGVDTGEDKLLGYFTLALNIFHFDDLALSKSKIKKFTGFYPHKEKKEIAVYLIGQLAKNQEYTDLFGLAEIRKSQEVVGGRCVLVESKNLPQLVNFYTENDFNLVRQDTDTLLQFVRIIG